MDFNKKGNIISLILYFILICLIIILLSILYISYNKTIIFNIEYGTRQPVDYIIKDLENCYLTIHNFVSFNSTLNNQNKMETSQNFKTYIYSYSRPYLIELIQNTSRDCFCYK